MEANEVATICQLGCDVGRFAAVRLLDEPEYRRAHEFDGRQHRRTWQPLRTDISSEGERGDFVYLFPAAFGVDGRAMDVLAPLQDKELEFLPVSDASCHVAALLNVINVVDALDESASEIKYFSSSGRVMRVIRYAFKRELVAGSHVFRVPQLVTILFATTRFRDLVTEAGLTGLLFEPLN